MTYPTWIIQTAKRGQRGKVRDSRRRGGKKSENLVCAAQHKNVLENQDENVSGTLRSFGVCGSCVPLRVKKHDSCIHTTKVVSACFHSLFFT